MAAYPPSPSFRSGTDTEVSELIETEKQMFDARYSYIAKVFKIIPEPMWEKAKVVRYDDNAMDVFVLCGNTNVEEIFDNDPVLVIMKRGNDVFSFMKMLPADESIGYRLNSIPYDGKVFLEMGYRDKNGIIVTQNLGFYTQGQPGTRSTFRSISCQQEVTSVMASFKIDYTRDGTMKVKTISREDWKLICESAVGDGVSAPEAGGGGAGIPSSRPFPGTSGSGNTGGGSSGDSGSSSGGGYTGGGNYGSGYYGGGYGGGDGYGGSNNYSPGANHPQLPKGGFDLLPILKKKGGDQDQDPYAGLKAQIRKEKSKLIEGVEKYIPWPDGVLLKPGERCNANARAIKGNIEICTRFFEDKNLTDKDRISILYHEVYHIRHHNTFRDFVSHELPAKITLQNVPPEFKQFFIDHVVYGKYFSAAENEKMYLDVISFSSINPPEYYRNEIEAYENEIRTVTDVSDYYNTQRRYKLWENKQLYDISKKYYGK